ncbi:MAG: hypothetical protein Q9195_002569 [Heterodermia aff. obscurata]
MVGLMAELDRTAPRIDIQADQIELIDGPAEFYTTLKSMIRKAKRRIFLSTLYIGKTEHELISAIGHSVRTNPDLKVSILTDALRGTRESPEPSCASLLASLTEEFPERVEIRMYHTPNLTGLRKRFIPKRINEGWGLQHIKLYGIDDELILSGANLSNDYFTNRQDRYHVFASQRVTDYFANIHNAVCSVSFLLKPADTPAKYTLEWPSSNPAPSPLTSPEAYIEATTSLLIPFTTPPNSRPRPKTDTSLYPLLCQPPNLNTELPALRSLLSAPSLCAYTFTAGYFNPHPEITTSLLSIRAPGTILTASPLANGFYNSPGVSGLLPAAYSHLSLGFLRAARKARARISLREWRRGTVGEPDGWTYHAKGLWVTLLQPPAMRSAAHHQPGDTAAPRLPSAEAVGGEVGPCATVVGSSNYTKRSYGLDLEVGALVVSSDEGLMKRWKREEELLVARSRVVGEAELAGKGRRAGWTVRGAMWIVKILGGAL